MVSIAITTKPYELFSKAAPSGFVGKIFQYPLFRILIAIIFILPSFIIYSRSYPDFNYTLPDNLQFLYVYYEAILGFLLFLFTYRLYTKYVEKRDALEVSFKVCFSQIGIGFLISFIIVVSVVLVLVLSGCYSILGFTYNIRLVLDLFVKFFMGALVEEIVFRLILFKLTEELLGTWIALIIQGLLFAIVHAWNDNATLFTTSSMVIVGGLVYGGGYILTRSLWLPLGLHWGWNFFQTGMFGMRNSGMTFRGLVFPYIDGPEWLTGGVWGIEASYITILLCFIVGVVLVYLAKKNSQFVLPRWKRSVVLSSEAVTL
jgi:uncharacterized protein